MPYAAAPLPAGTRERMTRLEGFLARRRDRAAARARPARLPLVTGGDRRPDPGASRRRTTGSAGHDTAARRALFDNLPPGVAPPPSGAERTRERPPPWGEEDPDAAAGDARTAAARAIDEAVRRVRKADWRGNRIKEREVRNAVRRALGGDDALTETIFEIVKAQHEY